MAAVRGRVESLAHHLARHGGVVHHQNLQHLEHAAEITHTHTCIYIHTHHAHMNGRLIPTLFTAEVSTAMGWSAALALALVFALLLYCKERSGKSAAAGSSGRGGGRSIERSRKEDGDRAMSIMSSPSPAAAATASLPLLLLSLPGSKQGSRTVKVDPSPSRPFENTDRVPPCNSTICLVTVKGIQLRIHNC